jgi:hypothetical protein
VTLYSARVAARVLATGILIRLATDSEVRAAEDGRRGLLFRPEPPRAFWFARPSRPPAEGEAYVVSQVFVEFVDDRHGEQRWEGAEHHGHAVSLTEDATMDLLKLAAETADDGFIELLGDMGIARVGVSRWALMSAPRRIDLSPELEGALAPLRRR